MTKLSHGFSLVEMAVVLIIIGLLMGGLLTPLSTQMNWQKTKVTQQRLEEIKEALLGFAIIHNRLPCVDIDGNGQENKNISECEINGEGYLPWKDLGVGRYDAWGNPFRYRPDKNYTTSIVVNRANKLRIRTIRYTTDTADKKNWLTIKSKNQDTRVVAIIFSCGQNGNPDPTPPLPLNINYKSDDNNYYYTNDADGSRNTKAICNNENNTISWKQSDVYIYDGYLENSFDDVLTWLSKNTLMNRLITAGKWPPPP